MVDGQAVLLLALLAVASFCNSAAAQPMNRLPRSQAHRQLAEMRRLLQTTDPYDAGIPMVDDELIVKLKPSALGNNTRKNAALGKGKGLQKKMLRAGDTSTNIGDLVLVTVTDDTGGKPSKAKLKEQANSIQDDDDVEYAEPNFVLNPAQAVTNDPYYTNMWGMLDADAGANAKGAWAAGFQSCSNIVIGLLDTGIQITHPDLQDIIWTNPGEVAGDGKDNDNNGRVDDVDGWDFYNNDNSPYDDTNDNHGTHVAGTIGAVGNNGVGVVGVCQRGVKIIPAKFLGGSANSGTVANAVSALWYLLDLKNRYDLNLVATSNSWGGGGFSQTMYDAINAHNSAGILFVAAAGNSGANTDVTANYPSNYNLPNVISVAAHAQTGSIPSFSNYGATTVDIFAPGVDIISTWPVSTVYQLDGTSMATPHVTGAIALYAANYLRIYGVLPTAASTKSLLLSSGVASGTYSGKCTSGRRLNIYNMLSTLPVASPSPSPSPSASPPPPAVPPSPSPSLNASTPSPSPSPVQPPSPSPAVSVPPPSPPAESPSPAPNPLPPVDPSDPRPRMKAAINITVYYDSRKGKKWFYCNAKIRARNVTDGAAVSSFSVEGVWSVSPDNDGYTDVHAEMPYTVTGSVGTYTRGSVDSPWIPTKDALQAWQPAQYATGYPGTRCVFTLSSLTHTDYVLDPAVSDTSAQSVLL